VGQNFTNPVHEYHTHIEQMGLGGWRRCSGGQGPVMIRAHSSRLLPRQRPKLPFPMGRLNPKAPPGLRSAFRKSVTSKGIGGPCFFFAGGTGIEESPGTVYCREGLKSPGYRMQGAEVCRRPQAGALSKVECVCEVQQGVRLGLLDLLISRHRRNGWRGVRRRRRSGWVRLGSGMRIGGKWVAGEGTSRLGLPRRTD